MWSVLKLLVLGQAYFCAGLTINRKSLAADKSQQSTIQTEIRLLSMVNQPDRKDYTYTTGVGAHKFHNQGKTWNEARLICEGEGAHLAIIDSPVESAAIAKLFSESEPPLDSVNHDAALVGFHDLYQEGAYVTIHGDSLEMAGFAEWHPGEPNNFGGSENCGAVWRDGKYNDVNCHDRYAFICELKVADQAPDYSRFKYNTVD